MGDANRQLSPTSAPSPSPPSTPTLSEVKRRALRHPGLSSALGGDIGSFSDVEMSTVGTSGGTFGSGGSSSGSGGGKNRGGPSRVIKARFRFVGRRGGEGWAEVNVSDWEDDAGEDGTGGIEYDRVFGEFLFFVFRANWEFTNIYFYTAPRERDPFPAGRGEVLQIDRRPRLMCVVLQFFPNQTKAHAADVSRSLPKKLNIDHSVGRTHSGRIALPVTFIATDCFPVLSAPLPCFQ